MKKNKALLINFGGLGDQILFLPAIESLRRYFKDEELFFMTEQRSLQLGELIGLIGKNPSEKNIIQFDYKNGNKNNSYFKNLVKKVQKAYEFVKILRAGNYDYVFSTGRDKMLGIILFLSGIKNRFYIDKSLRYLGPVKTKRLEEGYIAELLHECTRSFAGGSFEEHQAALSTKFKAFADSCSQGKGTSSYASPAKKMIGIHPGVSKLAIDKNLAKEWSAERWAQLIKQLIETGHKVTLFGGPDEEDLNHEIVKYIELNFKQQLENEFKAKFFDLSRKTKNIRELASYFTQTDLIICLDSFAMHLAYSLNKKTIALFNRFSKYSKPEKLIPPEKLESQEVSVIINNTNQDNGSKADWDLDTIMKAIS